ncbi:MAG TPA: cytochrome P450 [Ktedonobacteraceae bacterium]|nr:cytochrome P450 [Ktedonobacteraceae bacterium]
MQHSGLPIDLSTILHPESIMHNPFPAFHSLRENKPLYWDEETQSGIATGYEACIAVLRSPHFCTRIDVAQALSAPAHVLAPFSQTLTTMSHMLVLHDPPLHTHLRSYFSSAFTHSNVEVLRPQMQLLAEQLLDALVKHNQAEILHDFAYPFVGKMMASILGIPQEDCEQIITWSCDIEQLLVESSHSLEQITQWLPELAELIEYLRHRSTQQQHYAPGDFFQSLVAAWQQEQQLDRDDVLSNIVFLLLASIAATAQLIGKAFYTLLCHPEQYQLLQAHPHLITPALEELLRFDGPIVYTQRLARTDFELYNQQIKAGQSVLVCLAAANRDPAQFSYPDRLDICRTKKQNLGFGYGIHACLAAYLARTMAEIAISSMLRRFAHPNIVKVEREPLRVMRYLKKLTIAFEDNTA